VEVEMNLFPDVKVVLVETSHPGNIGGAARAMKNMGLMNLCLVSPKDFPSDQALWRAASAADLFDTVEVVNNLEEAIADCTLVIGSSARNRRIPWPMLTPSECGERVVTEMRPEKVDKPKIALLFGREDRGLTNEELQRCQFHVNIPTSIAYSSLNLAMAVQVVSYELLKAFHRGEGDNVEDISWDMEPATQQDVEYMMAHLERTLVRLKFHDPDNPRQLMVRLQRMFNRIRPDEMEVSIMRGILTAAVEDHLPKGNKDS